MDHTKTDPPKSTQAAVTITLALSMGLAALGTSIANIALPALALAFAAPFPQVQAIVVGYLVALTISVVAAGRLGDRFGLRRMLVVGLVIFALSSLLCALAPGLWLLVAARALQGVGAAFLMTLAMALMRQTAAEARIGRAMGLLGTISALGTALGPVLGGLLIPVAGWRGLFWVQVPLATLALVMAWKALPADQPAKRPTSARAPRVLSRGLVPNLMINVLVAAVMMTTLVVGPFYLGLGLGLSPTATGLAMAVGPAISILGGVPAGQLVDRWGAGRMLAVGLILLAVGAFGMALLPGAIGLAGYVLAIAILAPGYQIFQAANNTAALADVPKDQRGTASGLLNLSRNAGLIAGASAMGAVFAFGVGSTDLAQASPAAIGAGLRLTFLLAGALMVAAIGIYRLGQNLTQRLDQRACRQ